MTGGQGRVRQFLTLLVPADVDAPQEPPATLEESGSGWIVRQGDLAVSLGRKNQPITHDARRRIRIDLAE